MVYSTQRRRWGQAVLSSYFAKKCCNRKGNACKCKGKAKKRKTPFRGLAETAAWNYVSNGRPVRTRAKLSRGRPLTDNWWDHQRIKRQKDGVKRIERILALGGDNSGKSYGGGQSPYSFNRTPYAQKKVTWGKWSTPEDEARHAERLRHEPVYPAWKPKEGYVDPRTAAREYKRKLYEENGTAAWVAEMNARDRDRRSTDDDLMESRIANSVALKEQRYQDSIGSRENPIVIDDGGLFDDSD